MNCYPAERSLPRSPIEILGRGDVAAGETNARVVLVDGDEAISAWEWETAEQHRVEDAEHRGVRADTKGQRRDDDQRIPRPLMRAARRDSHVVPDAAEPAAEPIGAVAPAVHLLAVSSRAIAVSEFSLGLALRFVDAHAFAHELLRAHLDVELELLVQVGADLRTCAPGKPKLRTTFHGILRGGIMLVPARETRRSSMRATPAFLYGVGVCPRRSARRTSPAGCYRMRPMRR